ncbi:M12 family metallopeptidase [Paludibacterium paludis]|uniref:Peptidase M12A domain-containing protein n=1 Tax=Paludibacterium paludis TaxID=1225769 RepID=A0A918U701_9NEIS|nr:M12 family metallopeptidase [Paludibacterium paludis]GGY03527.1 hypothetical protein GCM10011289_02290 [Paludibacterium paludis]
MARNSRSIFPPVAAASIAALLVAPGSALSLTLPGEDETSAPRRSPRAVVSTTAKRWPMPIPYALGSTDHRTRHAFLRAARHLSDSTGVCFVERTYESDYLYVVNIPGKVASTSNVGMIGGPQMLELNEGSEGHIALHELMHALGFLHEHQRSDRDRNVKVVVNDDGQDPNDSIRRHALAIGAYDFDSVTHGEPSLFPPRDPARPLRVTERDTLSAGDIAGVRRIYPVNSRREACRPFGFNGLSVDVSKRILNLVPGARRTVRLALPPHVTVRSYELRRDDNNRLNVMVTQRPGNVFELEVEALPNSVSKGLFSLHVEFFTFEGTPVLAHLSVDVSPSYRHRVRQIVSSHDKTMCLEARPRRDKRSKSAMPQYFDMMSMDMNVHIASCDPDNVLQLWEHSDGGLLATATGHYLVRESTHGGGDARLALRRPDEGGATEPVALWQETEGQWRNMSMPGSLLTFSSANLPMLAAKSPHGFWQKWEWY